MHYLMFMERMVRQSNEAVPVRYLFSGTDRRVRSAVLQDIVRRSRQCSRPLYVIDDAEDADLYDYHLVESAGYRVEDGLSGNWCLYNPFQINTLEGISQFRQLLTAFGYDEKQKAKLLAYFRFLLYLESLAGHNASGITAESLAKYSACMAVEEEIQDLLEAGKIDSRQQMLLLSKYSECSSAAADFEDILLMIQPFIQGETIFSFATVGAAFVFRTGVLGQDDAARSVILRLLQAGLKEGRNAKPVIILLDRGNGERKSIAEFLNALPISMDVHLLSEDFFTLCGESDRTKLLNRFTSRIYCRHATMASCKEIEAECGEMDVLHTTYSESYDRRWRANSPLDIWFGRNKTEVYGRAVPVREPRYRKETIAGFPDGTGIICFMGQTSLFNI